MYIWTKPPKIAPFPLCKCENIRKSVVSVKATPLYRECGDEFVEIVD